MKMVAFTIKGLENIAENELLKIKGVVSNVQKYDKVLLFDYEGLLSELTNLKTVDDIGFFVCNLDSLTNNGLFETIKKLSSYRQVVKSFSITSSIAKVDIDIDKDTLITDLVSQLISYGLVHTPEDRRNLDFRVFQNEEVGFIAIRLTVEPLNKRDYEIGNYLGALKPTIAAALVQVATENLAKDARIVDNFCGSGTILCEAFTARHEVYGGDINPEAVSLTTKRLKSLGYTNLYNIRLQDAIKTKWNPKYFDCAISNLPWDKQHKVSHLKDLYSNTIKEYKRILKPNFRLCIICHKPEQLIKHIKKEFGDVNIKRIDIGYLGQTPSIILATNL